MREKSGIDRRLTFFLVVLVVTVGAFAATVYILWRLQVEAVSRQQGVAEMYATAFEDHLTQSFNVIDHTLAYALAGLGDQSQASAALGAALRHMPYLRSLSLLDAQGEIVASSEQRNIGVGISRNDFLPPTVAPRAVLRAAQPWAGRDFHDGRPASPERPASPVEQTLLPVLRDIAIDYDIWETVLAAVNTDYLLNYYGRSVSTVTGAVELLRYDGTLLLSTDTKRKPGSRTNGGLLASHIAGDEMGRFEQRLDDGRFVLTAYRASRLYPFVIVVNLDKEYALAGWRQEAERTVSIFFAVLLAAFALASLYFIRMERAARQHDADVEQLRWRGAALEAAANAIMITDPYGTIKWANPAFCTLSGYCMDEIIGRNPRDLIRSNKQTTDGYQDLWQTILAGQVWHGELINRRKDGACYVEEQIITPVRDESGAICHFIAVKEDTTERRQNAERLAELSRHLVVVQESARRRLSSDLHDRTSPNLAAIGVNLDIIDTSPLPKQSPMLTDRLNDVRALIEDTTASIREICSDLRPPVLDYAGLAAALESYAKQFQRRTGIVVRVESAHPTMRLAPALESALFRIAQEALTNCAKHSRASLIVLQLILDDEVLSLTVSDDGIGFDPDSLGKTTHTRGLGMLTMREMAEFSGGCFVLESCPGKGSRIKVEIQSMKELT